MDKDKLEIAILRALYDQGIKNACVDIFQKTSPLNVLIWTSPYPTATCKPIMQQLGSLDPDNVRELDKEIAELIEAGLLERKDGGYALTDHHQ